MFKMEKIIKRVGHVSLSFTLPNQSERISVFGGYVEMEPTEYHLNQSNNYCDPTELLIFDLESGCWTSQTITGQVPPANSGTCGVVVDNSLYIYGGVNADYVKDRSYGDLDLGSLRNFRIICTNSTYRKSPLHRDKLVGWEYKKRIYFFGGFGTPPPTDDDRNAANLRFEYIPETGSSLISRGWNNQLAAFNVDLNQWEYPITSGHAPSPRAALSVFICQSKAFLFRGKLLDARMNGMYALDMESMSWSENLNVGNVSPCGRSFHSFTSTSCTSAILYGGLSSDGQGLGDSWLYNTENNTWTELKLESQDKRFWHQSVYIDTSLFIIGGVKIFLQHIDLSKQERTVHCDFLRVVSVAP